MARPALGYLILVQVYLIYHRYVISVDNNRDGNQRKSDNCNNGNKTQKQTPTTKGTRNTEACSLGEPLQYIKHTLSLTTINIFDISQDCNGSEYAETPAQRELG